MAQQLFPPDVLEKSVEGYLPSISVQSQWIYWIVVIAIVATMSSLPFVYIDVSVPSAGALRTMHEKTELRSLVGGIVSSSLVNENQTVKKNQVLYEIRSEELSASRRLNADQQKEKLTFIKDLGKLSRLHKEALASNHTFATSFYAQQFFAFQSRLQEIQFHQQKVKKELDADKKLYAEKAISMREFDAKQFEYTQLLAQYESAFQQQIAQWQSDLTSQRTALQQLASESRQLDEKVKNYVIKAPVAGTFQQSSGKYAGSAIQAGEMLGIISPDDSMLIAECYIPPSEIGLIKLGQSVLFRIDAFNYNEWGMIKGIVTDIARDFTIVNNQPIFKIKCTLGQKQLKLKNGYKVSLTKGLSLRAEFIIAKRSLYQLIYDKVDNWLNPNN